MIEILKIQTLQDYEVAAKELAQIWDLLLKRMGWREIHRPASIPFKGTMFDVYNEVVGQGCIVVYQSPGDETFRMFTLVRHTDPSAPFSDLVRIENIASIINGSVELGLYYDEIKLGKIILPEDVIPVKIPSADSFEEFRLKLEVMGED